MTIVYNDTRYSFHNENRLDDRAGYDICTNNDPILPRIWHGHSLRTAGPLCGESTGGFVMVNWPG